MDSRLRGSDGFGDFLRIHQLYKKKNKMNLKKVQIELDVPDVQQVLAIALDEDKNKALEYIKGRLAKKI